MTVGELAQKAPQKWKLPWEDNEKVIVFHLRLSDGRHRGYNGGDYKDYNGKGAALYFKDLIENNKFNQYSKEKMNNYSETLGDDALALPVEDQAFKASSCSLAVLERGTS